MKLKALHDTVKDNYENGKYDQRIESGMHYEKPSKRKEAERVFYGLAPVSLILLIVTIDRQLQIGNWLRWIILVLFIISAIGVIYTSVRLTCLKNEERK
ncbi:hypothetical protein CK797_02860 [Limosilactobacillus pontis]|uniref:Uncharacterized protein n=1 Tax=Limosilactobacillus pontis TaxID=35787 RepID=A0A2J6NPF9_9LACO|nr:hypothetical protein [Limosilactobacillus pontis]PMB83204.1 hypothetical protein CK797_02860 [Limosilactobacillus pontis]